MTGLMAVIMIYGLIVARLRCPAVPGALRQAAGYRSVVRVRAAGVHHHRRRHSACRRRPHHPFMSQGGSSLVCNWIVAGLLLVISHQVRKPRDCRFHQHQPDVEQTQLVKAAA